MIQSPKGVDFETVEAASLTSQGRHDSWGSRPVPAAEIYAEVWIDGEFITSALGDCSIPEATTTTEVIVTTTRAPELPDTGAEHFWIALAGLLLVGGGLALVWKGEDE